MAFFLMSLYAVFLLVRPHDWYQPIQNWRFIDLLAIATILTTLITRGRENLLAKLRDDGYVRLMAGLFGAVLLSDLTKLRVMYAIEAFQDFGKQFILFLLALILVDHNSRTRKMFLVILACAGVMVIHAALQVQRGYGFGKIEPYTQEGIRGIERTYEEIIASDIRVRGSGIFRDPNDFAMLYVMAFPFTLALLQAPGVISNKLPALVLLPGFLFVLYHTKSRGGLMGFAGMILAYMWMTGRRSFFRLIFSIALIAAAAVLGPERATQTVYEGSAGGRIVAWGVGNSFLKANPLFGIGYNRWGDFERLVAHSSFVTCYAELGLVGYFFWFTLIYVVLRALLRIARLPRHLDPLAIRLAGGLFAGLVGYVTCAFFLTRTYNPVLYFLLGLGVGLIRHVQRNPQLPPGLLNVTRRDLLWGGVMSVASIPAIWVGIRLYWAMGGGSGG